MSSARTGCTGPFGAKKPFSRTLSASRIFVTSSGQKDAEGGAGVSPGSAGGASSSEGKGGRSSSACAEGASGAAGAESSPGAAILTPEASCSSTRPSRALRDGRASASAGSHSCMRQSSASTRRLALFTKPSSVSCRSWVMRSSSAGEKRPSRPAISFSVHTPESIEAPDLGAVFRTSRSRLRQSSSSSMAVMSLPFA